MKCNMPHGRIDEKWTKQETKNKDKVCPSGDGSDVKQKRKCGLLVPTL